MLPEILVVSLGILAAVTASLTGFGIGSLLTPFLALHMDMKTAIALVALPHLLATSLRLYLLRRNLERRLFLSFGLASATGGLVGALLLTKLSNPALTLVLGVLLVSTGLLSLTGAARKFAISREAAWLTGVLSGFFGGLAGNQGGIRAAALSNLGVSKLSFVATATAAALLVDLARLPLYLGQLHSELWQQRSWIGLSCAGVLLGTLLGHALLKRIPEELFQRTISVAVLALGLYLIFRV
jgi:uncharacterized membrane protein YfcA